MLPFPIRMIYYPYECAELGGVRHEQSNKKEPFVCAGRAGAHCICHVAPICKPAFFTRSGCQLSAQWNLCVFVQRMVLLYLGSHRTDAGAALPAGNLGTDGAVDSSALGQILHQQHGRSAPAVVFLLFSDAVHPYAVGLCIPVVGEGRGFSAAAMDEASVPSDAAAAFARSDQ